MIKTSQYNIIIVVSTVNAAYVFILTGLFYEEDATSNLSFVEKVDRIKPALRHRVFHRHYRLPFH